jgi:hypothetical protein
MKTRANDNMQDLEKADKAHLTEIVYHQKMNRLVVILGTIIFLFFSIFHYWLNNDFQAGIYALLFINAIFASALSTKIQNLDRLILLKRCSGGIAFCLVAVSLLAGILTDDIYIFLPWLFTYPVGVTLFFGKRIGIFSAIVFTLLSVIVFAITDFPPWDASALKMFKLNVILALITIMSLSLISEKIRTRVQSDLVASHEEYKRAEQHQREVNVELQHGIERRIHSEKLLSHSETRYRALF